MDVAKLNNSSLSEISILCFGDSNTYGQRPEKKARYGSTDRWTRKLHEYLPADRSYYIIEEGLGGRFTNLDHPDSSKPSKNGWLYFRPCVASHNPDITILMLGTNDAQKAYHCSAADIAKSMSEYLELCLNQNIIPLLIAPVIPNRSDLFNESIIPKKLWNFDDQSVKILQDLPNALHSLAQSYGVPFLDANLYVKLGEDGLHWSTDGHQEFAKIAASHIASL